MEEIDYTSNIKLWLSSLLMSRDVIHIRKKNIWILSYLWLLGKSSSTLWNQHKLGNIFLFVTRHRMPQGLQQFLISSHWNGNIHETVKGIKQYYILIKITKHKKQRPRYKIIFLLTVNRQQTLIVPEAWFTQQQLFFKKYRKFILAH